MIQRCKHVERMLGKKVVSDHSAVTLDLTTVESLPRDGELKQLTSCPQPETLSRLSLHRHSALFLGSFPSLVCHVWFNLSTSLETPSHKVLSSDLIFKVTGSVSMSSKICIYFTDGLHLADTHIHLSCWNYFIGEKNQVKRGSFVFLKSSSQGRDSNHVSLDPSSSRFTVSIRAMWISTFAFLKLESSRRLPLRSLSSIRFSDSVLF